MEIEATQKLFTVEEYYRLADVGILRPQERVELIEGKIIPMSPIGSRHSSRVARLSELFSTAFKGKAVVFIQGPLQLTDYTEPEPDLTVLKWRADYYEFKIPIAEDALLVIEVSDTSLRFDRKVKLPLYAAAGVPEVWIENIEDNELLVHRDPAGDAYSTSLTLHRGDNVSAVAFPDVIFKVDAILG